MISGILPGFLQVTNPENRIATDQRSFHVFSFHLKVPGKMVVFIKRGERLCRVLIPVDIGCHAFFVIFYNLIHQDMVIVFPACF